jgi:DNA-binding NtrC family response regulator
MNILLVDDDEAVRESVATFLSQLGYHVRKCGDGREALALLKKEAVHLVLSDIQMPHLNGFELLRNIRGNPGFQEVAVVLFTGHGDVKSAVEAMREGAYDYLLKPIDVRELAIVTERIGRFLALKREHDRLSANFAREVEIATLDMKRELDDLRKAYAREVGAGGIGLFSDVLREVFQVASRIHRNREIPAFIEGETGTGKEVLARYIHYGEGNITTPFIGMNCAAITANLFESELFGYEAGAFTGGKPQGQKGKIELARGGSLFLDEITELPLDCQAKLLRVIQERRYYPVGGLRENIADVRFICATNQNVHQKVEEGAFREDLYYRLNVGYIRIPPLRERREEIVPLARMFLADLSESRKTPMHRIGAAAACSLESYHWPGNVRQLKNTIERVVLLFDDPEMLPEHLDFVLHERMYQAGSPHPSSSLPRETIPLPEETFDLHSWTIDIVRRALERYRWNKTKTAQNQGITRNEHYTNVKYNDGAESVP